MKTSKLTALVAAVAAALLLNASHASAQDDPAPAASPAPAPTAATTGSTAAPNPAAGDRQQFRQRMMDRLKTALKATDEEWTVIQPLLEKVQTKEREAGHSRRGPGGWGGPGPGAGGPGPGAGAPEGEPNGRHADAAHSPETADLKAALTAEDTPTDTLKTKLEAVRAARKKNNADLEQAREELRKVLTLRQEATLVLIGILE